MFDKDFIKKSNLRRYKRYFKVTKDYDWVAKFAEESEGNEFEEFGLASPNVSAFMKSLNSGNSVKDSDRIQTILGRIVASGLVKYFRQNLDSNLPAMQTWKYSDPEQGLENYIISVKDSESLEAIRRILTPAVSRVREKDRKDVQSVVSSDQKLRNAIRYAMIRGYDNLYEKFVFDNPLVGFLPQNIDEKKNPFKLSSKQIVDDSIVKNSGGRRRFKEHGVEQKKDFILRTTIGPRLDDYIVGLRIGMSKALHNLESAKKTFDKRSNETNKDVLNSAYKSVAYFAAHIDHAERGYNALQELMKDPTKHSLKYSSKTNSDYLTNNPYIANIDGQYTYSGLGEFLRKSISHGKTKKSVAYTNWKGEVDFWRKPEPTGAMVTQHYVENIVTKPDYANSVCMDSLLSLAYENEFKAVSQDQDSNIIKAMMSGAREDVTEEQVKKMHHKFRRFIAETLHDLARGITSGENPFSAYEDLIDGLKRTLVSESLTIASDGDNRKNLISAVESMVPRSLSYLRNIGDAGKIYDYDSDGNINSKLNPKELSYWKKDIRGSLRLPEIMKSSYFSSKYVKNQQDYDNWEANSSNINYVKTIESDLPKVDDEFLTNLGIKPVSGAYDLEFLESLRKFFTEHRDLATVAKALEPVNHSAFFVKIGRDFLTSFGQDMEFLVGLQYHNSRVQGGEVSVEREYDPRVGQIYGSDIDPEDEEDISQSFAAVQSRRKGLGNMEFRKKVLSDPDKDILNVMTAIETGDVHTYFDQVLTEIRPAVRPHKKFGIATLDTQSAGGIFEKIYFDQNASTWESIDADVNRFYNWLTFRFRYSMGKHTWDRNRSQLTEIWSSGRQGMPASKTEFMEMIGAFADPFIYKLKTDENETAEHAMMRAASKLGRVPDHNIISSYKHYFDNLYDNYVGQNEKIKPFLVRFSMDHRYATDNPFEKHPEVLKYKNDIEKRLRESGVEYASKDWIKILLGELDPEGEMGKISEEFKPDFDPQDDEKYKDAFNISSKEDIEEFFFNIPSYVLNNEEKEFLINFAETHLQVTAFSSTAAFVSSLVDALNKAEIYLENQEELSDFLGYVSEIRYNGADTYKDEDTEPSFQDDVRDFLERSSRYFMLKISKDMSKAVLEVYLKDAEKLLEEGEALLDQGDDLVNKNPELMNEYGDLIGSLDNSALPKLEKIKESLEAMISKMDDSSDIPLSHVQLKREDVKPEIELEEDSLLESGEDLPLRSEEEPEDDLPWANEEDVEELPWADEEDIVSLDDKEEEVAPPLPKVEVKPYLIYANALKQTLALDFIRNSDTSGIAQRNALDFANRLESITESEVEMKDAMQALMSNFNVMLQKVLTEEDTVSFLNWFGDGKYEASVLAYLDAVLTKSRQIQSFLNIEEILSSAAAPVDKVSTTDEDDDFYHF